MKLRNKHTGETVEINDILITPMKIGNLACANWIAGWQVTTDTYVGKFYHHAFWEEITEVEDSAWSSVQNSVWQSVRDSVGESVFGVPHAVNQKKEETS